MLSYVPDFSYWKETVVLFTMFFGCAIGCARYLLRELVEFKKEINAFKGPGDGNPHDPQNPPKRSLKEPETDSSSLEQENTEHPQGEDQEDKGKNVLILLENLKDIDSRSVDFPNLVPAMAA